MKIGDINPYIRYASVGSFRPYPGFGYAADCRLFYVRAGKCRLNIGEKEHLLSEGALVLICPGEKYRFSDFEGVGMGVINFDFDQSRAQVRNTYKLTELPQGKQIDFEDFSGFDSPIVIEDFERAAKTVENIAEEYEERRLFFREKISAQMKLLILDIVRYVSTGENISGEKIDAILSYISSNTGKPLCAEELGAKFGYHPYYMSRLIRLHTGKSLKQYVIDLRIGEAKRKLRYTDLSLYEIALQCGFENVSYFSNSFKKKTGVSPGKYRKDGEGYI